MITATLQAVWRLSNGWMPSDAALVSPSAQAELGEAYDALRAYDGRCVNAWRAMADETAAQAEMLQSIGLRFEVTDVDPYDSAADMMADVDTNRRIRVLSTESTGGHPVFTPDENDTFRGVHDVFGHYASGRGFDRHGEEAAYRRHALMYSSHARLAMATETRGQNAALIRHGEFQSERIDYLPRHWRTDHALRPRTHAELVGAADHAWQTRSFVRNPNTHAMGLNVPERI